MAVDGRMPAGEWPRPKPTRPWACRAKTPAATCTRETPCASCRGRSNQSTGRQRQRDARKALEHVSGVSAARFWGKLGNEETWHGLPIRVEVKSGAQVGPIWTRYAAAEAQSNAAKAIGDPKPFVMIAIGERTPDGLFICRLSELGRVMEALVNA